MRIKDSKIFQKKYMVIFFAVAVLLFIQVSIATEQEHKIKIILNDEVVSFSEKTGYPFLDKNERLQVPFRVILEKFGAKVSWNGTDKIATAKKGDITVKVPIGKKYIYRNNDLVVNDTESMIVDGRTYLPIRVVMEAFNCEVDWSGKDQTLYIKNEMGSITISKIPTQYDLRKHFKTTSVKDQKEIGACWAFATLGAIESVLLPQGSYDFSEDHLSLNHGYNVSQDEGGDFNIAMSYLARWDGPILETEDPYGDGKTITKGNVIKHVQEAKVLPSKDYTAIKLSLLLNGGLQSAMYFDESLMEGNNTIYNAATSSYYYKGTANFNHAVVIVGWDDDYPKENFATIPEGNGAFICKNSYGKAFGESGYFYVSYYDKHIGTENIAYTRVDNVNNYTNLYQTDKLGWIGKLGYGSDMAYFANAYNTKSQREYLEAVSFYATGDNTRYEVYVVSDFNSAIDFKNMKLVKKGRIDYKGYYTIDFNEPILVEGKFAVAVKITTANSSLPVAAEYYKDVDWLKEVDISDGEGYMSADGISWDRTEKVFDSNVCLKAFTNDK